jgi:ubiquitin carboxyl-terminal hydrolase 14
VSVKWNKENYDLDFDLSDGLETFQGLLFSLTNVPIERQKLMNKGKLIKDNTEMLKLTDGAKLILLGAADSLAAAPSRPVLFEEDLTEKEKIQLKAQAPASGLQNLGNT